MSIKALKPLITVLPRYNRDKIDQNPGLSRSTKNFLMRLSDDELREISRSIQGGRISQAISNEERALEILKKTFRDLASSEKKAWDFISHKQKMVIDLKSPSVNNNTPPEHYAIKYLEGLPKNYSGLFVVDGPLDKWRLRANYFNRAGLNLSVEPLSNYH